MQLYSPSSRDYQRFYKYIQLDNSDKCWLWLGSKTRGGYGCFYLNGRLQRANRASYILNKGVIPDGQHVLHTCDNPPCINPKHLFLGTIRRCKICRRIREINYV